MNKYFVAGFAPEHIQSEIPDDCRFKNDGGTFKVQFDDNRCGNLNLTEDDSGKAQSFVSIKKTRVNDKVLKSANDNHFLRLLLHSF